MRANTGAVGVVLLIAIIIGALFVGLLGLYGYAVSIRNQALLWETDINAVYRSYENEMAT